MEGFTKEWLDEYKRKDGRKPLTENFKAGTNPYYKKPKMTKTEMEYARIYLAGIPHKFEGITLKMANSHRYTPDFYVSPGGNVVELHEVKGGHRLHSYARSRLAFDQARIEFPEFVFIWATKNKNGWIIKRFPVPVGAVAEGTKHE